MLASIIDDEAVVEQVKQEDLFEIVREVEELVELDGAGPPLLAVMQDDGDNGREEVCLGVFPEVVLQDQEGVLDGAEDQPIVGLARVLEEEDEARLVALVALVTLEAHAKEEIGLARPKLRVAGARFRVAAARRGGVPGLALVSTR